MSCLFWYAFIIIIVVIHPSSIIIIIISLLLSPRFRLFILIAIAVLLSWNDLAEPIISTLNTSLKMCVSASANSLLSSSLLSVDTNRWSNSIPLRFKCNLMLIFEIHGIWNWNFWRKIQLITIFITWTEPSQIKPSRHVLQKIESRIVLSIKFQLYFKWQQWYTIWIFYTCIASIIKHNMHKKCDYSKRNQIKFLVNTEFYLFCSYKTKIWKNCREKRNQFGCIEKGKWKKSCWHPSN